MAQEKKNPTTTEDRAAKAAQRKADAARKAAEAKAAQEAAETQAETEAPVTEAEAPKTSPSDAETRIAEMEETIKKLEAMLAHKENPQIIQIVGDAEKVTLRFQADVADDNVAVFGPNGMYGQITGKTGTVIVPKNDWSRFYDGSTRRMIERRWLIVLSGLTEDERRIYNCDYKEGELLDEQAFHKMLDMGEEMLQVYPLLCRAHQEMVASRYRDAWAAGDPRVDNRELILALNELSKKGTETLDAGNPIKKGLFFPIIEAMNARDSAV